MTSRKTVGRACNLREIYGSQVLGTQFNRIVLSFEYLLKFNVRLEHAINSKNGHRMNMSPQDLCNSY